MRIFRTAGLVLIAAASAAAAQRAPVKLPPRPEVPPPKPFVYPAATIDSLPNGLRFAVVENHELPLVVVRTAMAGTGPNGISFLDPAGKQGAWGLMLTALREGTTTRSATQIRDEVAELGTDMFFTNTIAFTPPWFRAPKSRWLASLDILADALVNPSLPSEGIARVQAQQANLLDRINAATATNRTIFSTLYGAESPNSQFATGPSIRGVTRDDLLALKDKYLRPQNTIVVIVGDVTVAEARQAMKSAFGSWAAGGTTVTQIIPTPAPPAPTTIYLKDYPGLAQTFVAGALVMPPRNNPDAAAIEVMASVLGDLNASAGSRTYAAFRTDRGLSYGIGVYPMLRPIPETAPLAVVLTVSPASIDTAVTLLRRVIGELRDAKPATASELEFAKKNTVGNLPLTMERIDAVATNVANAMVDREPANYLNKWAQSIDAVTLSQVHAVAAKYLDPDRLAIIVIGDRAKVEAGLRATGMPVVIVEK